MKNSWRFYETGGLTKFTLYDLGLNNLTPICETDRPGSMSHVCHAAAAMCSWDSRTVVALIEMHSDDQGCD